MRDIFDDMDAKIARENIALISEIAMFAHRANSLPPKQSRRVRYYVSVAMELWLMSSFEYSPPTDILEWLRGKVAESEAH